ncbi:hypothetical protein GCM10009624_32980 [Gordonia sinesedis]
MPEPAVTTVTMQMRVAMAADITAREIGVERPRVTDDPAITVVTLSSTRPSGRPCDPHPSGASVTRLPPGHPQ